MEQFEQRHLEAIKEGVRLFNAQKYWECHEDLEHYWLEEAGPIRNVYWAVIQVAAAMIHYREENLIGAKSLVQKAKQKLERCEQFNVESKLLNNNLSWQELKLLVRQIPSEPELLDFKKLFNFRFKDPEQWK